MLKGNYTNRRMHDKILELVAEWSRQQADTSYTIFSNEIESAGVDMSDCKNQGRTRDCVAAVAQIFSRFGQRLVDAPLLYEALCTNEKLMTAVAPHFEAIKTAMDTCLAEAPVGKKPRF